MKMRKKRLWWESALESHYFKKKKVRNAEFLWSKTKGPRPLVNTNDSWCCKWTGNCENAATRRFFERSLMDKCASLPGSLLAPVPRFWTHWGIRIKHVDRVDPYYSRRNNSKVYKFHYLSKTTIYFTLFLRITIYDEPCLTGDYSHVGGLNHLNQPTLTKLNSSALLG